MLDFTPRARYRKIIAELTKSNDRLREDLDEKKKAIASLNEQVKKVTEAKREADIISRNVIEKLRDKNQRLDSENRRLKESLERAYDDIEALSSQIAETNFNH